MSKQQLQTIRNNPLVKKFFEKPNFLDTKTEEKLVSLIDSKGLKEFYNYSSELIKKSSDVTHLYIYLLNKLETQNKSNETLKNRVCSDLFRLSFMGWLDVNEPNIIEYCKNNTSNKDLLKKIKKVKSVDWYEKYISFIPLEEEIGVWSTVNEKKIDEYYSFVKKLFRSKEITKEQFDWVKEFLWDRTIICQGEQIIGSILSLNLQNKLGFDRTAPKVKVIKQ